MKYHNHHIVPRHAGGSNDPSNIIRLTVAEHADAHRLLFEEHGRLADKVAWKMLSGKTAEGEAALIEMNRQRQLGSTFSDEHRANISKSLLGKVQTLQTRQKISEANKGQTPWSKGKRFTEIHKQRLSTSTKGVPHVGHPKSPETRAKMSKSHLGIRPSLETRKKLSVRPQNLVSPIKGRVRHYRADGSYFYGKVV